MKFKFKKTECQFINLQWWISLPENGILRIHSLPLDRTNGKPHYDQKGCDKQGIRIELNNFTLMTLWWDSMFFSHYRNGFAKRTEII